jgi:hypothetical protein
LPVSEPSSTTSIVLGRGFRHVVRNVYSFRFDPLRLDLLASRLPAVMAACQTDLDRFCSFLEALDAPTSPA